jgi:hypothetical protein
MTTAREDYVEAIDNILAGFEQKLDGLDLRVNGMTGTTKANFINQIAGLRDQRKLAASRLGELKKADIESWTTLRGEVDSSLANLERCYTRVSDMMYEKTSHTSATPKAMTH